MKFLVLLKVFLLAFLIVNIESRNFSSKSVAALKRFKKNIALTNARIYGITLEKVGQVAFGFMNGLWLEKKSQLINLYESSIEFGKLSYETFKRVNQECLGIANAQYEENLKDEVEQSNKRFSTFISVMSETDKKENLNKYIQACYDKDYKKIDEYTIDFKNLLRPVYIEEVVEEGETKKNQSKNKSYDSPSYFRQVDKDILQELYNYLLDESSVKSKLTNLFSSVIGKRNICHYLDGKATWTNLIKRWTDYAQTITKCGAKELTKEFFKQVNNGKDEQNQDSKAKYPKLVLKFFNYIFQNFTGINFLAIAHIVSEFLLTLRTANNDYFKIGEGLGKSIAMNINITSLIRRKFK